MYEFSLNLDAMINNDFDDDRTVAVPTIDVISNDTFAYSRHDFPNGHAAGRGMVNLNFQYVQLSLLPSATLHPSKPFETPIMGGSLFAINADFWWEIGAYDDGLNTYGMKLLSIDAPNMNLRMQSQSSFGNNLQVLCFVMEIRCFKININHRFCRCWTIRAKP